MAYDLKLAPEPEHGVMPAILIAFAILIVIAIVVFLVNPRETAKLALDKVDLYAPHTEIQQDKNAVKVVGLANASEDDLYVVATVEMTDKLRLPLFISGTTMILTSADGSAVEATGVSPRYYERLGTTFPTLAGYLGAPFYGGDAIQPGETHKGVVLFLFPGMSEASWKSKKSAVLTVDLRNQTPQTVALP